MVVGLTGQDLTASQGTAKAPNETAIVSGLSIKHQQTRNCKGISSQEAELTGQNWNI